LKLTTVKYGAGVLRNCEDRRERRKGKKGSIEREERKHKKEGKKESIEREERKHRKGRKEA
jgi:hypothetical protein